MPMTREDIKIEKAELEIAFLADLRQLEDHIRIYERLEEDEKILEEQLKHKYLV